MVRSHMSEVICKAMASIETGKVKLYRKEKTAAPNVEDYSPYRATDFTFHIVKPAGFRKFSD